MAEKEEDDLPSLPGSEIGFEPGSSSIAAGAEVESGTGAGEGTWFVSLTSFFFIYMYRKRYSWKEVPTLWRFCCRWLSSFALQVLNQSVALFLERFTRVLQ